MNSYIQVSFGILSVKIKVLRGDGPGCKVLLQFYLPGTFFETIISELTSRNQIHCHQHRHQH